MAGIRFQSYELAKHNPFDRFPAEKLIVAEADQDGRYVLHAQLKNGYGLTSVDKFDLQEAESLTYGYAQELGYPQTSVWIDLPDHVLEQPAILNRRLKKYLKKNGLYRSKPRI